MIVLLLTGITSFSQDSTQLKKKITFKAKFNTRTDPHPLPVYILDINDTAVVFIEGPVRFRSFTPVTGTRTIPYHQIEMATINRKGAVGRGILFGGIGGFVLGGLIGAISYKSCDNCWDFGIGFDILAGGTLGMGVGAVVGTVVGLLSKRVFRIGGNKQQFEVMRLSVLDRAYK